jgi:hypothetical protein
MLAVALSFASSMVLQRDAPNVLWGRAAPGARVSAALGCAGCPALSPATAGADGTWRVALPALPATATPFAVTVSAPGAADVVLDDVLVGDVLLCTGQSVRLCCARGSARGRAPLFYLTARSAQQRARERRSYASHPPLPHTHTHKHPPTPNRTSRCRSRWR